MLAKELVGMAEQAQKFVLLPDKPPLGFRSYLRDRSAIGVPCNVQKEYEGNLADMIAPFYGAASYVLSRHCNQTHVINELVVGSRSKNHAKQCEVTKMGFELNFDTLTALSELEEVFHRCKPENTTDNSVQAACFGDDVDMLSIEASNTSSILFYVKSDQGSDNDLSLFDYTI